MKTLPRILMSSIAFCGITFAAEKKAEDPAKLEEMTRLQILLDNANFGPGKIDGRGGEFTSKALARFRKSQGAQAGTQPADLAAAPESELSEARKEKTTEKKSKAGDSEMDLSGLDLQSVGEAFIQYTITKEDVDNVGEAPKEPAALAKLKSVPYRSVLEAVAEKFHSDMDFLKEINTGANLDGLKEGDTVKVPNVQPFELATVKEIKPGEAFQEEQPAVEDEPVADDEQKKESAKMKDKDTEASAKLPEGLAIFIDTKDNMLELREKEQILAAFPVTPGSESIPTPRGEWKVKGVARMPDFRYDKKMLKEGERGEDAHLIPPGPNNPVGIVWIALNKKGIGIHGTDDPETIGRAASHGCIRLANWDAAKLARMVKGGVPVKIE